MTTKPTKNLFGIRKNGVRELTDKELHKTAKKFVHPQLKGKNIMAIFDAPWCPYCVETVDPWVQFAEMVKDDKKLAVVSANCDKHKKIGKRFDIEGFPTIKLIKIDGTIIDYANEKTPVEFFSFYKANI